jgi:hypothetical protein
MTPQRPDPPRDLTALQASMIRPLQLEKAPPCGACASGTDVRGWIALIAQRRKLGFRPGGRPGVAGRRSTPSRRQDGSVPILPD